MADERVRVETVWSLRDEVSSRVGIIRSATAGLSGQLDFVKAQMFAVAGAAGVAFGTAGVVNFVRGLISTNRELENVRFSMGGLLYQAQQLGEFPARFRDLNEAMAYAARQYEDLERYAARALGTTQDYVAAWQEMALPVFRARGGMEDLLRLTQLIVPVAMQFRIPLDIAARDIRQALMGHMTVIDQTTRMLGLETQLVNELYRKDPHAVLRMLLTRMETAAESARAAGELMDARLATIADAWVRFRRELGAPLFAEVGRQVRELIAYIETHQDALRRMARGWGEDLRRVFVGVVDAVRWLRDHWDAITATVRTLVEVWLAVKLVGVLRHIIGLVSALRAGISGVAVAGAAAGPAAAAGAGGAARWATLAPNWVTVIVGTGVIFKGLYDYIETKAERDRELLEAARLGAPALYAEAREYARVHGTRRVYRGEIIEEAPGAVMAEYIAPRLERALAEQARLQAEAAQLVTEVSEQSSMMAALVRSIAGQTVLPEQPQPPPKEPRPVVDMRGARIEVRVDARHTDPDRIAATIVNTLARAAMRQTRAATGRAYSTGG